MDSEWFVSNYFILNRPIPQIWSATVDPLFFLHHAVRHVADATRGNVLLNTNCRWSINCGMTGNAVVRRISGHTTAELPVLTPPLESTFSFPTVDLHLST